MTTTKKAWLRGLAWTALAAVAVIIVARTVWVCSRTEGGWEILGDHLVAGLPPNVADAFAGPREYLSVQSAKWLIDEAQRVKADPSSSAADLMGAALATSGTTEDGWAYGLESTAGVIGRAIWMSSLDLPPDAEPLYQRWEKLRGKFQQLSLSLAARATQLEPVEPDWWRLRALFVWISYRRGGTIELLDANALYDAKLNDRENALYDYIVAGASYPLAVTRRDSDTGEYFDVPFIVDQPLMRQMVERYRVALENKLLATGVAKSSLAETFFRRARGSVLTKLMRTQSSAFFDDRDSMYDFISRPLWRAIDQHATDRELPQMFRLWEHGPLRIAAQCEAAGEWSPEANRASVESNFGGAIRSYFNFNVSKEYQAAVEEVARRAAPRSDSFLQGWVTIFRANSIAADWERIRRSKVLSVVSVAAATCAFLFLMVGLLGWLIGRFMHQGVRSPVRASLWASILLWLLLAGLSFCTFGLVLSYKPEWQRLHWVVQYGIAALLTLLVGWLVWTASGCIWRQGKLPSTKRSWMFHVSRLFLVLLGSMLAIVPLFMAVDPKARRGFATIMDHFPRNLLYAFQTLELDGIPSGSPANSIIQWGASGGLLLTVAFWWLVLLTVRYRRSTHSGGSTAQPPIAGNRRAQFFASLRSTSRHAIFIGAIMFLVSLAATTEWIDRLNTLYHRELARFAAIP